MAEIENLKIGSGGTIHIVGNEDIVAEAWAAGQNYVKDKSYVINNHILYVCNTTHTSTSPFDPTNWTQITVGESLTSLVDAINEVIATSKLNPVYGNTASGAIATFDTSLALPLQDCTIAINAVQESGTPTPSSPKLISGFTGANIYVKGANLWDEVWEVQGTFVWSKNYIPVKPNTSYYRKSPYNLFPRFYDNSFTEIGTGIWGKDNTFTTPSNASYLKFMVDPAYGTTYNNDISINYPATDTAYHAYNPNSKIIPVSWQEEAGIVYGGYLRIVNGIVKLVVTYVKKLMTTWTWSYNNTDYDYGYFVISGNVADMSDNMNFTCDFLTGVKAGRGSLGDNELGAYNATTSNRRLCARADSITDINSWNTFIADKYVCYELATPVEYTLTSIPPIYSIVGTNNVFTDTNGNTSVVYACSLKDYIDSQ